MPGRAFVFLGDDVADCGLRRAERSQRQVAETARAEWAWPRQRAGIGLRTGDPALHGLAIVAGLAHDPAARRGCVLALLVGGRAAVIAAGALVVWACAPVAPVSARAITASRARRAGARAPSRCPFVIRTASRSAGSLQPGGAALRANGGENETARPFRDGPSYRVRSRSRRPHQMAPTVSGSSGPRPAGRCRRSGWRRRGPAPWPCGPRRRPAASRTSRARRPAASRSGRGR